MTAYVIRRILLMVPVAFFLTLILFIVLRLTPGDPVQVQLGEQATPETVSALRHELGLDRTLPVQYGVWLGRIARGDLGRSLANRQPVLSAILERLPATLELGTLGFFFAILLVLVFAIKLRVLPVSGYAPLTGPDADVVENLRHVALPMLALAIPETAALARLVRSSLLETLYSDYIRTARAKGLSEWIVIGRHAMRNSALPLITDVGLNLGILISGAVLIETIFS